MGRVSGKKMNTLFYANSKDELLSGVDREFWERHSVEEPLKDEFYRNERVKITISYLPEPPNDENFEFWARSFFPNSFGNSYTETLVWTTDLCEDLWSHFSDKLKKEILMECLL